MRAAADEQFMRRALALAEKGRGLVTANPMVGAVAVNKGTVIAEGAHVEFGGAHAEAALIRSAARRAISLRGSTLYVSLEPCCHENKKTPPCVPEIIRAGFSRVVIAVLDPNPLVRGRGALGLRKAGCRVEVGLLQERARALNEKYFFYQQTGMPFVGMKIAMSADGKIATKTGQSQWITSKASREKVYEIRDEYDAIVVGKRTAVADNPRLSGARRSPLRILLDSRLETPLSSQFFRDGNCMVAATQAAKENRRAQLAARGITLKIFPGKIQLAPLMRFLAVRGVSSVLVEGGSEVFGSFLDAQLVNRLYLFIAPILIGGAKALSAIGGEGVSSVSAAPILKDIVFERIDSDFLVSGRLL